MPTARELLEQADALMRRNRGGDGGIPVLTEAVAEEAAVSSRGTASRERAGVAPRDQVADARAPRERPEHDSGELRREEQDLSAAERPTPAEGPHSAPREPEPPPPSEEPQAALHAPEHRTEHATAEHPTAERPTPERPTPERPTPESPAPERPAPVAEPQSPPNFPQATVAVEAGSPTHADRVESADDAEPPVLTDVVDELAFEASVEPRKPANEEPPWPGPDTIDPALHSITGPAPDTVGLVPPITVRAAEMQQAAPPTDEPVAPTRTLRAAGSEPTPPPAGSAPPDRVEAPAASAEAERAGPNEEERWRALSEQVSMQVLQRLDLFTDSGLKSQLASHLQPIVARASAELVEAINDHVGQLVRTYVAEAIEREIAQWRKQQE